MYNNEAGQSVFIIPAQNVGEFDKRLDKLNRKADKLGTADILFYEIDESFETLKNGNLQRFVHIVVEGVAPVLMGWEFLAKVEHDRSGIPVFKVSPNKAVPDEHREHGTFCTHCQTNRYRKHTYLVRNTVTGRVANVGSTCLKDFMGFNTTPNAIASFMEDINALASYESRDFLGYRVEWEHDLASFLTNVATVVRNKGWVSKGMASNNHRMVSSGHYVAFLCGYSTIGQWDEEQEIQALINDGNDDDAAQGKAALEWALTMESSPEEYLRNLHAIAKRGYVSQRTYGLATSMVAAHTRFKSLLVAKKNSPDFMKSEYVGDEGKRMNKVELTVHSIYEVEGTDWQGDPCFKDKVTFLDTKGNVLVWFCSGVNKFEKGLKYLANATVTKHGIHQGKLHYKKTNVTRVHLVKELKSATA